MRSILRALKEHFTVYIVNTVNRSVTALPANPFCYYSDPFIWQDSTGIWVLVEQLQYFKQKGRLCAIKLDGPQHSFCPRPILALNCHASFPYLFEDDVRLFMVPETCGQGSIDLYVSEQFPEKWRLFHRIMSGVDAADTVIFRHEGKWWLITSIRPSPGQQRHLALFSAKHLDGSWIGHPVNQERRFAADEHGYGRNAGSVIQHTGKVLRMMQANRRYYGESLKVMQIEKLTDSEYMEIPYAGPLVVNEIARRYSPHHISVHGDLVAFDVRDRVGYLQHVPLLNRWGLRPGASAPLHRSLSF
jgi:hypothetical protein